MKTLSIVQVLTVAVCLVILASGADAATLKDQQEGWAAQAKSTDPAYAASPERGKNFYGRIFRPGNEMASCATCHTANPKAPGKHVVTGKEIPAFSPSANPERFTDAKKSEKWFKRNCNDVIGRECTAAEKSDLSAWLLQN
jgi:cytochrome c553